MPSRDAFRVGYVVRRYPRYSETFVVREILAHEAAGAVIDIFSLRPPNDTHFQEAISRVRAPVTYLPSDGLRDEDFWAALEQASEVLPGIWSALRTARGEAARNVYQAILLACAVRLKGMEHLHAPFGNDGASVARLAARFAGVPYSFTARAKDIFHESARADDLRRKLSEASAVVTISDFNLQYLRATYGGAAAHVCRIYNGLDLDEFPYAAPHNRSPRVVAIGRLVPKKGFDDLVDACAILASRGISFHCQIIGGGELDCALRDQIASLGLDGLVELLGPRPEREVTQCIRGAAVLAAPCVIGPDGDRDGLPNVLFEAMALGTPCVSTDVTGIPEVVRDGETGLLVPQHDPDALATAIVRLLSDSALRVQLAGRARRLIEAEFDARRNAARRRALFQGAVRAALEPVALVG
jgi:glycosyltransferase involved in cell wall biosynthesis